MSPWQELGLTPDADEGAVRRAYAIRLKGLDVGADPEAFARLRAAYEAMLKRARGGGGRPVAVAEIVRPAEADPVAADGAASAAAVGAIMAALAAGQMVPAAALLATAEAQGRLSFAATEALQAEFLRRAAEAPTLPEGVLPDLARRFDWNNALHPLRRNREAFAALDRRLDAEAWYADLHARAVRRRRRFRRDPARRSARMLLRGRPGWWARRFARPVHVFLAPQAGPLAADLRAFDRHAHWLADRFDAARIDWCRRRLRPRRWLMAAVLFWLGIVLSEAAIHGQLGKSLPAISVFAGFLALLVIARRAAARRRRG